MTMEKTALLYQGIGYCFRKTSRAFIVPGLVVNLSPLPPELLGYVSDAKVGVGRSNLRPRILRVPEEGRPARMQAERDHTNR